MKLPQGRAARDSQTLKGSYTTDEVAQALGFPGVNFLSGH